MIAKAAHPVHALPGDDIVRKVLSFHAKDARSFLQCRCGRLNGATHMPATS